MQHAGKITQPLRNRLHKHIGSLYKLNFNLHGESFQIFRHNVHNMSVQILDHVCVKFNGKLKLWGKKKWIGLNT